MSQRQTDRPGILIIDDVQIRDADRGRLDRDLYAVRSADRLWNIQIADFICAGIKFYDRFHALTSHVTAIAHRRSAPKYPWPAPPLHG